MFLAYCTKGSRAWEGKEHRGALTCLYTMFKRSNCARGHRRHVHCRAQYIHVFLAAQSYPFCDFKEALSGRGCRPWMNIRFCFSSVRGCAPPLRGGYRGLTLKSALSRQCLHSSGTLLSSDPSPLTSTQLSALHKSLAKLLIYYFFND